MNPDTHIQALVGLLNAALEHTPTTTRAILSQLAQPHVDALLPKAPPAEVKPAAP